MIFKDYYAILGCTKSSSNEEIKKKYHSLALKYHPDKNQGDKRAEEKLKEINEAWNILGDKSKREEYDKVYAKEKATKGVVKRKNTSTTQHNCGKTGNIKDAIIAILFLGLIFAFLVVKVINNNLTFYRHFYNTSLKFQQECFLDLINTFLYVYTLIIAFAPTCILLRDFLYNTVVHFFGITKKETTSRYVENIVAAIIIGGVFFLSFHKAIRMIVSIFVFILGNIYIIRWKICRIFYSAVLFILMYLLFIPETFLETRSRRKFEICDGRIWCPGEKLDDYYKKSEIKTHIKTKNNI